MSQDEGTTHEGTTHEGTNDKDMVVAASSVNPNTMID